MPAVLKSSFSKCGIGTLSLVHPSSGIKERSGSWLCIFCSSATGGKDKDMEFNRDEFGKRVKQARMDKHLTQVQLADLLGVEWQQISRIERGFSGCSNELLVPLSEELDVSTDYLLKGVESDSELLRRQISLLMDQLSIFKSQIK